MSPSRFVAFALPVAAGAVAFLSSARAHAEPGQPDCGLDGHACAYPHFVVGVEAGVSHFTEGGPFGFNDGVGSATSLGPAWGINGGLAIFSWLRVDAHYWGLFNETVASVSPTGTVGLLTSGFAATVRLEAPFPWVRPYALAGVGLYTTELTGASRSQFTSSTESGVPVGVGLLVPLPVSRGLSVKVEGVFHHLFNESFSPNDNIGGGDPSTVMAGLELGL